MSRFLTIEEVAERLGVSKSTARRLKDRGELAYSRISDRCIRFPESAIEAYLQRVSCRSEATQTPKAANDTRLNLKRADIVFFDGSRPARRKPRRGNLKLVSDTNSSTKKS